jgi:hypothetical protein
LTRLAPTTTPQSATGPWKSPPHSNGLSRATRASGIVVAGSRSAHALATARARHAEAGPDQRRAARTRSVSSGCESGGGVPEATVLAARSCCQGLRRRDRDEELSAGVAEHSPAGRGADDPLVANPIGAVVAEPAVASVDSNRRLTPAPSGAFTLKHRRGVGFAQCCLARATASRTTAACRGGATLSLNPRTHAVGLPVGSTSETPGGSSGVTFASTPVQLARSNSAPVWDGRGYC